MYLLKCLLFARVKTKSNLLLLLALLLHGFDGDIDLLYSYNVRQLQLDLLAWISNRNSTVYNVHVALVNVQLMHCKCCHPILN